MVLEFRPIPASIPGEMPTSVTVFSSSSLSNSLAKELERYSFNWFYGLNDRMHRETLPGTNMEVEHGLWKNNVPLPTGVSMLVPGRVVLLSTISYMEDGALK